MMQDHRSIRHVSFVIGALIASLLLKMTDTSLQAAQRLKKSDQQIVSFEARANSLLDAAKDIISISDFERDDVIDYVVDALAEDMAVHPDRNDRDRIRFAQGKPVKRSFDLPLVTGSFRREEADSSFRLSVLPLSSKAVLLQFFGYSFRNDNVFTCDLAARAAIDSSGVLRGRSVNEFDEITIKGRVGRKGKSLKVQVLLRGTSEGYPGCGIGLYLDGTYVSY